MHFNLVFNYSSPPSDFDIGIIQCDINAFNLFF